MSRAEHGMQRQRHGVAKNLAEGVGGVIVGAALVVLASQWLKRRQPGRLATDRTDAETPLGADAAAASTMNSSNSPGS
ncbi:carbon monoxide dehydrogenase [Halochromatium sp.]